MLYRCNNCDFETDDPCAVNPEIPDFWARVESGDLCPEGTCRQCGAFVHRYDDEFLMKMAAPDLLAACRAALADLEGIMPEFEPSGDKSHPAWKTINELNSAIAKATGEDILKGMPEMPKDDKPLSADDVTDAIVDKIMEAAKQYHSTASRTGTVTIEISGGCLTDVSGLPEGWNYELIDHDERNSLVQELSKERCVELLAPTGLTFDINDPVEVLRCAVEQAVYDEAIDPSDIE